jgi:hypothetical protein
VAINTLSRHLTTWIPNNLIDRAAFAANANQTALDQADRAADIVPGSLQVDSQPPSSGGCRIDAQQVAKSFVATAGRNQIRYLRKRKSAIGEQRQREVAKADDLPDRVCTSMFGT